MNLIKHRKLVREVILCHIMFIVLIVSGCATDEYEKNNQRAGFENTSAPQIGRTAAMDNTAITMVAEKLSPSVVGITTTRVTKDLYSQNQRTEGVGSGVIVSEKGYILTNNHVAGNADSLMVSLFDGRDVRGQTVWADSVLDLAIVKINADRITAAPLGDSKAVRVGQDAIAIGNPLGLTFQRTVTAGIISAMNRTIEVEKGVFMEGLLQTDASINPGNSGGPLINANGQVVGINTVKVITAEGMGFAVPINVVKPVIAKVSSGGNYGAPNIGLQSFDKELGKIFDFTISEGVFVFDCKDGGCASRAGIQKGDAIISVNGKPINTAIELKEALNEAGEGGKVILKVKNGNGIKEVPIVLDGMKK
ncbi:trypsin-like peptidase domain-containing protein [Clostridium swellfunianum]|uniref:S1C family serine protease n=1 Tax=Clostridium swellfunianum TaxID=1367462 RepID=UPI00202FDC0E|nr:trypsin-like peptidase domain-containing protein [Clostridium swellfunianum]MCM0648545.1 trypsin-like peptidase domain-containing protein [Clostridium swellfunianum]